MSAPAAPDPAGGAAPASNTGVTALIAAAKTQRWFAELRRIIAALMPKRRAPAPPNSSGPDAFQRLVSALALPDYPAIALDARVERLVENEPALVKRTARLAAEAVIANYCSVRQANSAAVAMRDQHAKHHGCVAARFIVRDDLSERFAQGVFQRGAQYEAVLRFSNAMGVPQSDRRPDGRGLAIKLRGVGGETLLSHLTATEPPADLAREQDFLLTNQAAFFGKNVVDYARFIELLAQPAVGWQQWLAKNFRLWIGFFLLQQRFHQLRLFLATAFQPVDNPLLADYFSMTPYRLGDDLVVRYVVTPLDRSRLAAATKPRSASPSKLREALAATLDPDAGPGAAPGAAFDFAVQLRADASPDDVEDASRIWDRPNDTVVSLARIEIPRQSFETTECLHDCETLTFNPWRCLPQHRPLGGLNRMRLLVYLASRQTRHRLNMMGAL
jgi:hypothetical protein